MRFEGTLARDGGVWLAEVPAFDAMTQGRTRAEALEMVRDLVESLAGVPGFSAEVVRTGPRTFEVGGEPVRVITALLLRRQRERSGLSLAEVAARLGQRSRSAYARYEHGRAVPTIEKLEELLAAVSPEQRVVWRLVG